MTAYLSLFGWGGREKREVETEVGKVDGTRSFKALEVMTRNLNFILSMIRTWGNVLYSEVLQDLICVFVIFLLLLWGIAIAGLQRE